MAAGDITWFKEAALNLGEEKHNLGSDTLKLGLITSSSTPTATDATPTWGDYSANQVGTGGTSYTGPQTLGSVTWSMQSNVATLRAANVVLAQDASGFTNARWGIIYNDSDTGGPDSALAYVDLGTDRSIVTGSLTFDWYGANGDILTIS